MSEINIPYGRPYRDMSEVDNRIINPNSSSHNNANQMGIAHANPNMDMTKQEQMNCCPNMTLAMAYVLDQKWETPYEVAEGAHRGTLFPSLDKPFLGGGNRP